MQNHGDWEETGRGWVLGAQDQGGGKDGDEILVMNKISLQMFIYKTVHLKAILCHNQCGGD